MKNTQYLFFSGVLILGLGLGACSKSKDKSKAGSSAQAEAAQVEAQKTKLIEASLVPQCEKMKEADLFKKENFFKFTLEGNNFFRKLVKVTGSDQLGLISKKLESDFPSVEKAVDLRLEIMNEFRDLKEPKLKEGRTYSIESLLSHLFGGEQKFLGEKDLERALSDIQTAEQSFAGAPESSEQVRELINVLKQGEDQAKAEALVKIQKILAPLSQKSYEAMTGRLKRINEISDLLDKSDESLKKDFDVLTAEVDEVAKFIELKTCAKIIIENNKDLVKNLGTVLFTADRLKSLGKKLETSTGKGKASDSHGASKTNSTNGKDEIQVKPPGV